MEVKKITEGMTAPQVAQVIDDNFKGIIGETDAKLSELGSKIGVSVYSPINIDTKNKILDFGSDAVIEIGKQSYVLQNIHSEAAKYRAVPYYETNSGASKILFNIETKEIYPKVYTYISSEKEVLLGVVRSNYGTHEFINASFPFFYTIDGQDVWNMYEELAKEAYKNYFKGKDSEYSSNRIYGLKSNHEYVVSLKQTDWEIPETEEGRFIFGIEAWKDGKRISVLGVSTDPGDVKSFYEFKLPESFDYIEIGGRANYGVKVWYNIEDVTQIKTTQDSIGVSVYSPINIDTKNKILDFGSDAVIEIGKQSYVLQNIHSEIAKYRAVPYYETNSGASKILFNLETKEIYPKVYTYISSEKEVLLGVVRSNYGTHELINASFPFSYTIDGQDVWNKSAMNWDVNVKGVNHRGWHEAPENTLIAFQLSKLHGFQYVECDVSFTSDNVPVLLHDSTIDRTSNAEGNIGDLTYEQVLEYDFGSWKDEKYVGLKIPTLEEFLKLCRNIGLTPYLELKNIKDVEQVDIVVSQVKANGMRGKVTYISYSSSFLMRVKELDGSARLGVVVDEINEENISIAKSLRTERNDVFIDAYKEQSNIDKCIEESIPVECWTLNTYSEIVEANPYISGITSDRYIAGKVLYEKNRAK